MVMESFLEKPSLQGLNMNRPASTMIGMRSQQLSASAEKTFRLLQQPTATFCTAPPPPIQSVAGAAPAKSNQKVSRKISFFKIGFHPLLSELLRLHLFCLAFPLQQCSNLSVLYVCACACVCGWMGAKCCCGNWLRSTSGKASPFFWKKTSSLDIDLTPI